MLKIDRVMYVQIVSKFVPFFLNTTVCLTEITRSCPKLRHLELGNCSIGNKAVEEIAHNCTNLKYLSLGGCKWISKEVMKKLNPKIKIEYPDYSEENPM